MERTKSWLSDLDWGLVLAWAALVIIGCMSIYSATYSERIDSDFFTLKNSFGKQLMFVVISLVLGGTVILLDGKFFTAFTWLFFGVSLILLVLVIFLGHEVNGQKNWLGVGGFGIQPTEIAKFTSCLALAKVLSRNGADIRNPVDKLYVLLVLGAAPLIILIQGDFGSILVFIAFLFPLYREGLEPIIPISILYGIGITLLALLLGNTTDADLFMKAKGFQLIGFLFHSNLRMILLLSVIFGALLYFMWKSLRKRLPLAAMVLVASLSYVLVLNYGFYKVPLRHQHRINVMMGKEEDYNVSQSKIAIGSGGLIGKGFMKGTQTKYNFVPEQSTDFIFCTIGEEGGFLGSLVLLGLYVFVVFRLLKMASRQRSAFSRIYAYSVAGIFIIHVVVNIGMTIGLAPVIGIPLPFISYGGSALISFTLMLFIMIKLDAQRMQILR